jgi:hypothetical protein
MENISDVYFNFFIFKQFLGHNRTNGCDCWGSDSRLDNKINQIDLFHIFVTCASYDIKYHIGSLKKLKDTSDNFFPL